jgi:hypothetical protein
MIGVLLCYIIKELRSIYFLGLSNTGPTCKEMFITGPFSSMLHASVKSYLGHTNDVLQEGPMSRYLRCDL